MWHIQGVLVQPLCHQRIHLLSSSQGDHQISIQIEDFTDLTAVILLGVLGDQKTALLPRKKRNKNQIVWCLCGFYEARKTFLANDKNTDC